MSLLMSVVFLGLHTYLTKHFLLSLEVMLAVVLVCEWHFIINLVLDLKSLLQISVFRVKGSSYVEMAETIAT